MKDPRRPAKKLIRAFVIHQLKYSDMVADAKERGIPYWHITELREEGYIAMIRKLYNTGRLY
jgi:hypothetical protein